MTSTGPDHRQFQARANGLWRFTMSLAGALFLLMAGVAFWSGSWLIGAVALIVAAFSLTELRRSVHVRAGRLVAQGRLVRREVSLRDLTQVAIGPLNQLWVATTEGSFFLRMVPVHAQTPFLGVTEFLPALRSTAQNHGADLDPDPGPGTPAPKGTAPLFSL